MKAYKVELLVLDFEDIGVCEDTFREDFEYFISRVMSIQFKDIGEWGDDHPLNQQDQQRDYYNQLFKEEQ